MSRGPNEIDDIIEALQVVRFFRETYASHPEGLERMGQAMRLLKNKAGAENDLRSKVADAIGEAWGLDLTPRTDPTGRLVV